MRPFNSNKNIKNRSKEQLDINLAIGNDFTVVVFDEEKIKLSDRIENMIPG